MNTYYSWNTTRLSDIYQWSVSKVTTRDTPNSNGQYADTEVVRSGERTTRARASGAAKKIVRSLNRS